MRPETSNCDYGTLYASFQIEPNAVMFVLVCASWPILIFPCLLIFILLSQLSVTRKTLSENTHDRSVSTAHTTRIHIENTCHVLAENIIIRKF